MENTIKACNESSCLVEIGRKVSADYVAQAHIGRFGSQLSINFDLYNTKSGTLIDSFTGNSKDIFGLLAIIDEKAPDLFKQMPGTSGGSKASVAGGISGLEKASDYELDERIYLVNLSTEPSGAVLSFDGVASTSCLKTPCKAELREGSIRIIANLEQYEIADTTVSVSYNNQSIAIRLKPNFGILEIKPASLDDIGKDEPWNLYINGKQSSYWENRLSPGKYKVELSHRCYEDLKFEVGINKDSREIFDMASNIALKKGGLILSAERNGEPVNESVFVNYKYVGETPFIGAIPLCAKVEIGKNREVLSVKLEHNEKIRYVYKGSSYVSVFSGEPYAPAPEVGKPIKTSFWVAFGLDLLGVAVIYAGYEEQKKMWKAYDKYNVRGQSQSHYKTTWKNLENHLDSRNMLYTVGGVFLASGIGVHIWF